MSLAPSRARYHPGLYEHEIFWADWQSYLFLKGYELRNRYNPNWRRRRGQLELWMPFFRTPRNAEDEISIITGNVLDAVRISDGQKVVLKLLESTSAEIGIHQYLDSPPLRSDPRNHTIPVLDVLPLPDTPFSILVTPFCREFDYPPFHCRQEFVDAMTQYIEGLEFMHEQNIAHMDIAPKNMLMDESRVVPKGSHFSRPRTHDGRYELFCWTDRCSVSPVNYYYIDFGLSRYFPEGNEAARKTGTLRTFPDIPELSLDIRNNPFPVDIFHLGLTMHKLIYCYPDLEIFRPVADAMTAAEPFARAKPAQSLAHLRDIAATIPVTHLREQIWDLAATPEHKRDRAALGGYQADYDHIRKKALYGFGFGDLTRPPASTYMRPKLAETV
ncbi:kinase-like domain-containing protein [Mycena amicta]|nr:kinase-like domain-containing protein [Mycena amicta]